MALSGCQQKDEIVTYKVPKKIPEQLLPEKQRMLAAMVPRDGKVWFFKVLGPKSAVDLVADPFRDFVTGIQFDSQGEPELGDLPDGWRRGGEKAMRHATIDINTPKKQLDLSISFLPSPGSTEGEVWDTYVDQNINRWRGQVGLKPSTDKWAGGTEIKIDAAEGVGVWFDQSGDPSDVAATSMGTPPMMAGGMGPMNPGPLNPGTGAAPANPETQAPARPKIEFNSPDGWQEIQASGMREVAFKLGSDEQAAEVTIITAGGDLRSNVARWMGQVAGQQPADAAVDEMMASVQKFQVSGREAQRFIIAGDAESGKMSIDATIVDLGGGFSKFIKMTGNPKTVAEQTESMRTFLESLSF
ncbi:MAG: hypothetical protein KDB00_21105 [Planctomycetales bacterium]|nr:hypothetical protein [Planctomycetales bacterium]